MPRITQLKDILNGTLSSTGIVDQVTGEAIVATEDLSNLVDVGKAVLDYTSNNNNKEAFIKALIDQVGKIMFVDRVYSSQAPSILMDSWEYGTVLEKVRCEVPDTRTNATWDLFNYPYTAPLLMMTVIQIIRIHSYSASHQLRLSSSTQKLRMKYLSHLLMYSSDQLSSLLNSSVHSLR